MSKKKLLREIIAKKNSEEASRLKPAEYLKGVGLLRRRPRERFQKWLSAKKGVDRAQRLVEKGRYYYLRARQRYGDAVNLSKKHYGSFQKWARKRERSGGFTIDIDDINLGGGLTEEPRRRKKRRQGLEIDTGGLV